MHETPSSPNTTQTVIPPLPTSHIKQIISPFPKTVCIMFSICLWVLFLVLGIMGIYMKQVSKITTTTFMTKMSYGSMICASIILLV